MKFFKTTTTIAAAALFFAAGAAQQAAAQEKKPNLKSKHGAWEVHCIEKRCTMAQTVTNKDGQPIMFLSVLKLPKPKKTDKGDIIAQARIITPLHVSLPHRLGIRIDDGKISVAPFVFCNANGCEAHPVLTSEDLKRFQSGKKLELITVFPTAQGPKARPVALSLENFSKAYGDL